MQKKATERFSVALFIINFLLTQNENGQTTKEDNRYGVNDGRNERIGDDRRVKMGKFCQNREYGAHKFCNDDGAKKRQRNHQGYVPGVSCHAKDYSVQENEL